MPSRIRKVRLDKSAGSLRRMLQYAFFDWTREMPVPKRVITWAGILIQGWVIYSLWTQFLVWPVMWPKGILLFGSVSLLYVLGAGLVNGMLTLEFVRKTQLEADQIAARQIQQMLIPLKLPGLPGYEVETFYKPFREVGGDYFDVVELPKNRTLFAVADVSGKGMPAALLAANIQALVRSIASVEANPLALARQINEHLSRYTPSDRPRHIVSPLLWRHFMLYKFPAGRNEPIHCKPSKLCFQPGNNGSEREGANLCDDVFKTSSVIPSAIAEIVSKRLSKNAENRYQTAAGLAPDLRRCLATRQSLSKIDPLPLSRAEKPAEWD